MTNCMFLPKPCSSGENGLHQASQLIGRSLDTTILQDTEVSSKDLCADITVNVHIASRCIISIWTVGLMTMLAKSILNASHSIANH